MHYLLPIVSLTLAICSSAHASEIAQWRGPERSGVYAETNLLEKWPEDGPPLLWSAQVTGGGYASVTVSDGVTYATGKQDSVEFLTAIDADGHILWQKPYGHSSYQTGYQDARCTPTVEDGVVYAISGRGEIVAVNAETGAEIWSLDAFQKFSGAHGSWEVAESPLIVDDKLIYTPAGTQTTMVALDKKTGATIWTSDSLNDTSAYVSPILIERGGKKIIATVSARYFFGVDAHDGTILWQYDYSRLESPDHPRAPFINCASPVYRDGRVFITSGYDHTGAMFALSEDGTAISLVWTQPVLDTHHGGLVLIDGYLYGSNWINNRSGDWVCLDWQSGEVIYEEKWISKGSIIAADGWLYCYEERRGTLALVKATPEGFAITSSFTVDLGSGQHWAHPVIVDGLLYLRRGDVVMAYDISGKS
ncbi:MAG: PQQ-binding-like beta-propeller repeat protein [Candidatus Latescibacteria bacterium]|nr:PQQ-binding-like beta-propeller repeat protein [Candidatus Latescibacterota bacterium]